MAESALEKLMRLAKEKKAASVVPVVATQPILVNEPAIAASAEGGASVGLEETKKAILSMQLGMVDKQVKEELANAESRTSAASSRDTTSEELESQSATGDRQTAQVSGSVEGLGDSGGSSLSNPTSDHPLAMQFAELEQALLAQQPEFKTILRQIHRHLGQEPELVTQMTEQEIQLIVSGLVVFANAEIVAPAAEKSAKAKIAAAKKQPISADDL